MLCLLDSLHECCLSQAGGVVDKVKVTLEKEADAEGGLYAVKALAEIKDAACEPYLIAMLPLVLEKYADKVCDAFSPHLASCNGLKTYRAVSWLCLIV